MATHPIHKPHGDGPNDDPEPGMLPVDPDDGFGHPGIPGDEEHDRTVDPEA